MQGEAASADGEAAAIYPEDTAETTNEGGCTKQQIFSVEEIAFYLKRCHLGLFTAREKLVPGFKVQADSLFRG